MSEFDRLNAPQKIDNSRSNQSKQAPLQRSTHSAHIIQRIRMNPRSFSYADAVAIQKTIGDPAVFQLMREGGYGNTKPAQREVKPEENEKVLQGKFNTIQRKPIRNKEEEEPVQMKKENETGLPDNLKAGVENLSGLSMDDVRVHYNSDKPAQVGALAYTQGTDIHVAPGQEKHLSHEAWHVVQQAQGRVRPTIQLQGLGINSDAGLEHEADVMGAKTERMLKLEGSMFGLSSQQHQFSGNHPDNFSMKTSEKETLASNQGGTLQRVLRVQTGFYLDRLRNTQNRFKNQVVNALNLLLAGTNIVAQENNGLITIAGNPVNPLDERYLLVNGLINNARTVTIKKISDGQNRTDIPRGGGSAAEQARITNASTPAIGNDAEVFWDPAQIDSVRIWNGMGVVPAPMPSFLILAHELIHAGRTQRGFTANDQVTGLRKVGMYTVPNGRVELGHAEEMMTVGLPAHNAAQIAAEMAPGGAFNGWGLGPNGYLLTAAQNLHGWVTENQLRGRLGMNNRVSYETARPDVIRPMGGMVNLAGLNFGSRREIPWGTLAAMGVAAGAFLAWWLMYHNGMAGGKGSSAQLKADHSGSTQPIQRIKNSKTHAVVQRKLSLRERNWSEAVNVEMIRQGVFRINAANGAVVVKTAADVDDPTLEIIPAKVGTVMGVNTVQTEMIRSNSDEITGALKHLSSLPPHGAYLAQAIKKVESLLIMPFIAGKDLAESGKTLAMADKDKMVGWGRELGRIWFLDLVVQNPDRHSENIRIGNDGLMYAIDQVIGPGGMHDFGAEKAEKVLKDIPADQQKFIMKLNSGITGFSIPWELIKGPFNDGAREAWLRFKDIDHTFLEKTSTAISGTDYRGKFQGIERIIMLLKAHFA